MALLSEGTLKGTLKYHLSKIAPKNSDVCIELKNGLKYIVRARTMDRTVFKEVWIRNFYDKYDIRVEEGDTVLDVGAHIGVFSIYAAEMSKTGKVYAFEPFSENFKKLENHKKINNKNNLFVFNKGVHGTEGTKTLYLAPDKNTGAHTMFFKDHYKNNPDDRVDIETITLKGFCDRENIDKIDFLKMDCERAEFDIFKADESILQRVDKIVMECHPYEDNTVDWMVSMLENNGFKVIRESNDQPLGVEMLYARK